MSKLERFALQSCVALGGCVPVLAGGAGVWFGPGFVSAAASLPLDSHFRYLSGLLLGLGFAFWSTIPDIERQGERFRLLTALVVMGGLGRLVSYIAMGVPNGPMLFGLMMELIVTPALAVWQGRLGRVH